MSVARHFGCIVQTSNGRTGVVKTHRSRPRPLSFITVTILGAIAKGAAYGSAVMQKTGLPSGTVYPTLSRLERAGCISSACESKRLAHKNGRPARRYYCVTAVGTAAIRDAV